MWSDFKFITAKDSYIPSDWYNNPSVAYNKAPIHLKLSFLLQQCILLNYIERAYNSLNPSSHGVYDNGILYLITKYKNDTILSAIQDIKNNLNNYENVNVVNTILEQLDILTGVSSFKLDSELCFSMIETHENDETPRTFEISDTSFYRPYLLFVENSFNTEGMVDIKDIDKMKSFKVSDTVTIPSLHLSDGNLLVVSYEQKFNNYSFDMRACIELDKTLNIGSSSILTYLYGYDWSTWTFNGLLGVLAGMCLELDANAIPQNSFMWLYYFLYRKVFGWGPHAKTRSNSLAISSSVITARRCVLAFITAIRDRYGVQLDDAELLSNLLDGGENANADNLHKYLNVKDASGVSVEMYTAFKRSMLGTFEELDFKRSKKQSLDKIMALRARSDEEVSASLQNAKSILDLDPYLRDMTFSLNSVLGSTGSGTKKAKNAAGDIDYSIEAEQETDKDSGEDDESVKPESPDSDDNNPDSEPVTLPGGDNEEMEEEDTHTQDPLPSVSDKRGVKLELSPNENTDTVLYRFELKAYVDALLANPPKYLAVQTINYLKKLKAFWWNCLSVQTLYDVLNSMVKVPKEYRIKKSKKQGIE